MKIHFANEIFKKRYYDYINTIVPHVCRKNYLDINELYNDLKVLDNEMVSCDNPVSISDLNTNIQDLTTKRTEAGFIDGIAEVILDNDSVWIEISSKTAADVMIKNKGKELSDITKQVIQNQSPRIMIEIRLC